MKTQPMMFCLLLLAAVMVVAADARADRYSTADPGGADAELRESDPTSARGTSTEIASRIADGSRNSVIYLKFGVGSITPLELANDITVQTTYRNTSLTAGRIESAFGGANTGFDYYVMDPTLPGADWDEVAITPLTAPAYNFDGDFRTKATGTPGAPTLGLTYVGTRLFDSADLVGASPHLPVGGALDLVTNPGSPLHLAIQSAQSTSHQTVTVAMVIAHDWYTPNSDWINFNYLLNPKEQDPLRLDADSPFSGMSNANGEFAPALITIPEPATLAMFALAGLALLRRR